MLRVIVLIIMLVGGYAWYSYKLYSKRSARRAREEDLRQELTQTGTKYTIPTTELEVVSTVNEAKPEPGSSDSIVYFWLWGIRIYERFFDRLTEKSSEHIDKHTSRFKYTLEKDGQQISIYSQTYPVAKDHLQFGLIGKDQMDIYVSPNDENKVYFDFEVNQ